MKPIGNAEFLKHPQGTERACALTMVQFHHGSPPDRVQNECGRLFESFSTRSQSSQNT